MIVNLTNDAWFGDTTEPWITSRWPDARGRASSVPHSVDQQRCQRGHRSRRACHRAERNISPGDVDAIAHWMKGAKTGYEMWAIFRGGWPP